MCSVYNVLSMECAMYRMCAGNIIRSTDSILFLLSIVEHRPSTFLVPNFVGTNLKEHVLRYFQMKRLRANGFWGSGHC